MYEPGQRRQADAMCENSGCVLQRELMVDHGEHARGIHACSHYEAIQRKRPLTRHGGFQSARTLHFVLVNLLVFFLIVHLAMLCLVGFASRVKAMITGHIPGRSAQ